VLSRLHSFSPHSRKYSESLSPAVSEHVKETLRSASQEFLQIETPAPVEPSISSSNQSSTAALIGTQCPPGFQIKLLSLLLESFDHKVQESGKMCPEILPSKFSQLPPVTSTTSMSSKATSKIPPRLLSDQYINIFFQVSIHPRRPKRELMCGFRNGLHCSLFSIDPASCESMKSTLPTLRPDTGTATS
jgi:hypothetical protein